MKRMRIFAMVLICCFVLGSETTVFAGIVDGTILGEKISLEVRTESAFAWTSGYDARTSVCAYCYVRGGNPNYLTQMDTISGSAVANTYAPNGWYIGKAESKHNYSGMFKTLVAYP